MRRAHWVRRMMILFLSAAALVFQLVKAWINV